MSQLGLIADIGGTNARFSLVPLRQIKAGQTLKLKEADLILPTALNGAEYETIDEAIEAYLRGPASAYVRPEHAVMAIACPTDQDQITMTNHTWSFSVSELKQKLGLSSLEFINDYKAMANAVPFIDPSELIQIGSGEASDGKPIAVTGPGTGLGLAALAFGSDGPVTLETEGGHAAFAPTNRLEMDVLSYLLTKHERVSNERLISGQGLENIYEALSALHDTPKKLSAPEITKGAFEEHAADCEQALSLFCSVFGQYAGDVALTIGAKGGVYITGGIIPRFIEYFKESGFRDRFESKGRLSSFVKTIPTYVVIAQQPGLLGCAAVLNYKVNQG